MSQYPKEGMHFEDARKRAVRIAKNPTIDHMRKNQLVCSLKNQSRLHDGDEASNEIQTEINMDMNNHSLPKLGWNRLYDNNFDNIFGSIGEQ